MEGNVNKCSNHEEINALIFCQLCWIYMCNKCKQIHLDLLKSHITYNLDKQTNFIFTGILKMKIIMLNMNIFVKSITFYAVLNV